VQSLQSLRVVSVLGILILYSACNSVPDAEHPRDVTSRVTRIKRETARPQTPGKTAAPPKRITHSGSTGAPPVPRSEERGAARADEAVVNTPVDAPPPSSSMPELVRAVATLSAGGGCGPNAHRAFVVLRNTDAFMKADASSLRLATIEAGVRVNGIAAEGDWRLVRFPDAVWGERAAYVRCSVLELAPLNITSLKASSDPSPNVSVPVRSEQPPDLTVDPRQKRETLRGYLEWQKGSYIVVDGQRVRWAPETQLQLGRLPFVSSVPAGYEMVVVGRRTRDGSLMAERIDAKPNGIGLHENEVVQEFDDIERMWLANGTMFLSNGKALRNVGRIEDTGPSVARVRRIMRRIVPPYVDAAHIRVHVVDSDEWNARAMANGAIWVNTGLLNDTSDDELAVVLGHELAHYTNEHTRRSVKNETWRQLAVLGVNVAVSTTSSRAVQETIATAAKLSLLAWGTGYSRNLEDQADRVGLRYAYEGGFDVERAVDMWSRVRSRFGETDVVTNWFAGDHSRPTDRIRNIRRELQLNYRAN
jgi:Peptidase family M48